MGNLADAVNYTAQWLVRTVGLSSQSKYLAYMGANDIRYATLTLACMKTGHSVGKILYSMCREFGSFDRYTQVLLLSPRNSEAGSLHILNSTKTSQLIYSTERRKPVEALQQADKSLQSLEIPRLWEIFDKKVDNYPCDTQYADAEDEAPIIIHSSGTTGQIPTIKKRSITYR